MTTTTATTTTTTMTNFNYATTTTTTTKLLLLQIMQLKNLGGSSTVCSHTSAFRTLIYPRA